MLLEDIEEHIPCAVDTICGDTSKRTESIVVSWGSLLLL